MAMWHSFGQREVGESPRERLPDAIKQKQQSSMYGEELFMSFCCWNRTGNSGSHHSDHEDRSHLRGRAGWRRSKREAWSCGHLWDAISALNCYLHTSSSGRKTNFLKPLFFHFSVISSWTQSYVVRWYMGFILYFPFCWNVLQLKLF